MPLRTTFTGLLRSSVRRGSRDEFVRGMGDLKSELRSLNRRLDTELTALQLRIAGLERLDGEESRAEESKPQEPRGRSRLSVLQADSPQGGGVPLQRHQAPASQPTFHGELSIREVLAMHPGAAEVLGRHHLPSCGSCAVSGLESLKSGLQKHGVALDVVLDELNQLAWN